MRLEIKSAATFLMNLLRMGHTLNEQQLDIFRSKLEDLLKKHYQHHWFPEKPCKGSGYRCLRINHKMDPLIARAAAASGVSDSSLLHNMFPNELTLWIDPREVSYRIGENGSICVLYDGSVTTVTSNNSNATSGGIDRYSTCKDSLRGLDNMIMDPRNMNFEQFATYVSS
jgi:protein Tob/BTG